MIHRFHTEVAVEYGVIEANRKKVAREIRIAAEKISESTKDIV